MRDRDTAERAGSKVDGTDRRLGRASSVKARVGVAAGYVGDHTLEGWSLALMAKGLASLRVLVRVAL